MAYGYGTGAWVPKNGRYHGNPQPSFLGVITHNLVKPSFFMVLGSKGSNDRHYALEFDKSPPLQNGRGGRRSLPIEKVTVQGQTLKLRGGW